MLPANPESALHSLRHRSACLPGGFLSSRKTCSDMYSPIPHLLGCWQDMYSMLWATTLPALLETCCHTEQSVLPASLEACCHPGQPNEVPQCPAHGISCQPSSCEVCPIPSAIHTSTCNPRSVLHSPGHSSTYIPGSHQGLPDLPASLEACCHLDNNYTCNRRGLLPSVYQACQHQG